MYPYKDFHVICRNQDCTKNISATLWSPALTQSYKVLPKQQNGDGKLKVGIKEYSNHLIPEKEAGKTIELSARRHSRMKQLE